MVHFIDTYSGISDSHLDDLVREAQSINPNTGIRLTKGFLKFLASKGHRVQFHRVRDALIRTDPVGIIECRSRTVVRREYNVHGPFSFWHMDGNHKLIR